MKQGIVIVGASGHGKVIADIIEKSGDQVVGFLDDDTTLPDVFLGYPVLGTVDAYQDFLQYKFVVAIGNAVIREKIMTHMDAQAEWYTAVHPSAVIGRDVVIGEGSVIMAGAVINPCTAIGKGGIINTAASVDHDGMLGDYVHVSVGAHLAGTVQVGSRSWIGAGAIVSNNIKVGADCMIGAGAVVVKDLEEPGTYVGVPARKVVGRINLYSSANI